MAGGATTLRDALLPAIDALRGIPATLGLRLYSVQVMYQTWSGTDSSGRSGVGIGTKSNSPLLTLKVATGSAQVSVHQVSQRDIINSGNLYTDQDLKIGPITPPYTGSAKDDDQIGIFDPVPTGSPTEVHFFVTGPGYSSGAWFKKIGDDVSKPFSYFLFLRKNPVTP